MKRIWQTLVCLLIAIMLCVGFVGCEVQEKLNKTEETGTNWEIDDPDEVPTIIGDTDSKECPCDYCKSFGIIDEEYEHKIGTANSNSELCEINEEFSEKWKNKIVEMHEALLNIAEPDFRQALESEQAIWTEYVESKKQLQIAYLQQRYTTGSIVPVAYTHYECSLYRDRTIFLHDMYSCLVD